MTLHNHIKLVCDSFIWFQSTGRDRKTTHYPQCAWDSQQHTHSWSTLVYKLSVRNWHCTLCHVTKYREFHWSDHLLYALPSPKWCSHNLTALASVFSVMLFNTIPKSGENNCKTTVHIQCVCVHVLCVLCVCVCFVLCVCCVVCVLCCVCVCVCLCVMLCVFHFRECVYMPHSFPINLVLCVRVCVCVRACAPVTLCLWKASKCHKGASKHIVQNFSRYHYKV